MKLEYKLTDNDIRQRIRDVRIAYGRDPHCIACSPDIHGLLNELYNQTNTFHDTSVYTSDTLYGIPIIVNPRIRGDQLLFLVDIDAIRDTGELEEIGALPQEIL